MLAFCSRQRKKEKETEMEMEESNLHQEMMGMGMGMGMAVGMGTYDMIRYSIYDTIFHFHPYTIYHNLPQYTAILIFNFHFQFQF